MQVGLIRNGVLNAQLNLPRVRITLLLRITETTAVALETPRFERRQAATKPMPKARATW